LFGGWGGEQIFPTPGLRGFLRPLFMMGRIWVAHQKHHRAPNIVIGVACRVADKTYDRYENRFITIVPISRVACKRLLLKFVLYFALT